MAARFSFDPHPLPVLLSPCSLHPLPNSAFSASDCQDFEALPPATEPQNVRIRLHVDCSIKVMIPPSYTFSSQVTRYTLSFEPFFCSFGLVYLSNIFTLPRPRKRLGDASARSNSKPHEDSRIALLCIRGSSSANSCDAMAAIHSDIVSQMRFRIAGFEHACPASFRPLSRTRL